VSDRRTVVLAIDPTAPDDRVIRRAADVLRAGGLVAFPTETVYGLGANALDPAAVGGIFAAKGRPATNPLIVHVDGEAMLRAVAASWPPAAAALAARFWPGPLTLVLPRTAAVPDVVTGGGPTVAVRMPGHPVALALIRAAGVPLAAPSANRSSELSPTRAAHVLAGLGGRIDLVLDGGPTANGIESTVLSLAGERPVLLRPGPIAVSELERVVGPIGRRGAVSGNDPLPSPGMLARHYAPRTPVELHADRSRLAARSAELTRSGERVASVVIGDGLGVAGSVEVMPGDAVGYAARLYDVLHELDGRGLTRVLVEVPPAADEWLAVRDRLTRAATQGEPGDGAPATADDST
jgi:L-threonylcarbamoyladenylate synthase